MTHTHRTERENARVSECFTPMSEWITDPAASSLDGIMSLGRIRKSRSDTAMNPDAQATKI